MNNLIILKGLAVYLFGFFLAADLTARGILPVGSDADWFRTTAIISLGFFWLWMLPKEH